MNKSLPFSLFFLLLAGQLFAQDDPPCIDTTGFGEFQVIYPQPLSESNPEGGISQEAIVDNPFEFTFAVYFNDTLNFPTDPDNPDAVLPVVFDSITFETSGAITYDPPMPNFTYTCDPPNCVFVPEELGCVTISGTPTSDQVGTHELFFEGIGHIILFGVPNQQPITYPSFLAPGSYPLEVVQGSGLRTVLLSGFSIQNSPNPFSHTTDILIRSDFSGEYEYRVSDLLGRQIERKRLQILEGDNTVTFDGSKLAEGTYLFTLTDGEAVLTQKLLISRH